MATVLSTLYPPLVDTFMPAFIYNQPAYITFSISPYNEKKQIKYIHISLVNQQTNINALAANMTAAGIDTEAGTYSYTLRNSILILPIDDGRVVYNEETEQYTVFIPPSLLRVDEGNEKVFSTDVFYKAQIRFDQASDKKPDPRDTSDYLIAERNHFSEWSSVCLLKAIPEPTLEITQFENKNNPPIFNPGIIPIIGRLVFTTKKDDEKDRLNLSGKIVETLRSYEIEIFNQDNPEEILDSTGTIFTGDFADPNSIYWLADGENAIPGETYVARIHYTTKNQYSATEDFVFKVAEYSVLDTFTPAFTFKKVRLLPYEITSDTIIPNEDLENIKLFTEEDGIVEFNVSVTNDLPAGWLYIKRSHMEEGQFKHWELLSCTEEAGKINRNFSDATVCSLERYAYSAQYLIKQNNLFTQSYSTNEAPNREIIYPDFYDIFLMRDGIQLAIRYDAKINSLTPVVNRQKIDTLGGKYPKFAENAQMNYKQFSISGYIDAESDFNRKFLNDTSEKYQAAMKNYNDQMNGKYSVRNDTAADETFTYKSSGDDYLRHFADTTLHDLYPQDNWWWQREFREQAIKWLNDGEPKLFRSMPEGNMSVMLTDISLTPNQTVSRRLYTFNATMYEIEDGHSLDTLSSLGIVSIPNDKVNKISSSDGGSEDDSQIASISTIGQIPSARIITGNSWGVVKTSGGAENEAEHPSDYSQLSVLDKAMFLDYDPGSKDGQVYQVNQGSIELKDVRIEFETLPQWYRFSTEGQSGGMTGLILTEDAYNTGVGEQSAGNDARVLGYKLQLEVLNPNYSNSASSSGSEQDQQTIFLDVFVDEKGYYQVPSNLTVKNIILYDGAIATVNYKVKYDLEYNTSTIPSAIDLTSEIVGQISGWWTAQTNLSELISKKYKIETYDPDTNRLSSYTRFTNWTNLGLDVTPYAVFGIQYKNESNFESYVVGRTGIFNLVGDYEFEGLRFIGRRMSLAPEHEPIDLDDWEFVLDDSAKTDDDINNSNLTWNEFISQSVVGSNTLVDIYTNEQSHTTTAASEEINRLWNNNSNEQISSLGGYTSISAIKNPKYNTVYGIRTSTGNLSYVIYYIDHDWYPVTFNDEYTILAEVPVSGMVNYRGKIVTTTY